MLEKFLQDIGLSDKEAKVYLSLLTRDTSTVLELSKDTTINRTTIYPILDHLMEIGLAIEVIEGKKKNYQAAPPERLETYIEKRKADLNEKQNLLDDIIPQLRSVTRKSGEQPVVKFYEGREGIIRSLEDTYRTEKDGGTVHMVYSKDLVDKFFTEKEKSIARKYRIKKNIKSKVLLFSSTNPKESDTTGDRVTIKEKEFEFPAQVNVFYDGVRIYTMGEKLSAIFIKSKDVADTLRMLMEIAFQYFDGKKKTK